MTLQFEGRVAFVTGGSRGIGKATARLLVEFGLDPRAAVLRVRDARPGAIQTRQQEKYILKSKWR